MTVSEGTLLGGRVRYSQPVAGYRTGIEPVLLAASVAAKPGEHVLEGGTGAGAAMVCLLARLPATTCLGVERDPALAALARANLADNGFAAGSVETADIGQFTAGQLFDHAIANPPWHGVGATASPDAMRDAAKRGAPDLLHRWAAALAASLRKGGSLTMIVPAAATARTLAAMAAAGCGTATLLPLWPRHGQAAKLLLIRSIRHGRGPCSVLPGLVLHEGREHSRAARAVLWEGAAITWR